MATMKVGAVIFEHTPGFQGEVGITRGDRSISVPMDALRALVAEQVRAEAIEELMHDKPAALLKPARLKRIA